MKKKWWLGVFALLALPCLSLAEWSTPVLLWEDEPGGFELAAVDVAIAVDAQEDVHIVFTHLFANPHYPHGPAFTQLSYTKFDAWGHQLVPETMLSDSVALCSYPKIGLFGMDSLWVVWFNAGDWENEPHGIATRSLDLNGNPLRPATIWTDSMLESPLGYAFEVLSNRSVVLAFSDVQPIVKTILMIHQRPDGTRILDHVPIFRNSVNGEGTDNTHGYADASQDSLQIIWREAYLDVWQAVFGKRASLQAPPVDSTNLGDHVALTPPTPAHVRGPGDIRPVGDSLIALDEERFDGGCWSEAHVHILRRADYSQISETLVGGSISNTWAVDSGGSCISVMTYTCTSPPNIRFKRYSVPDLICLTDSLVFSNQNQGPGYQYLTYTVSAFGSRHFVYEVADPPDYNVSHVYYMCWRADLAVGPFSHGATDNNSVFSVTPNPCSRRFTVQGPLAKATAITLYNILGQQAGREIRGLALQGQTLSFPTDDLPNGVYFLRIATPAGMTMRKVMVVK